MEEKRADLNSERIDFVKWFSEINKDSGSSAGGKGANLGEIFNLKLPVPPGFVVTAQAYSYFIEKSNLKNKISELLERIDYEDTSNLDNKTREIRELIENSLMPKEMEEEIIESYENLDADELDFREKGSALDLINKEPNPVFVAVRSSATAEDLADASFAGQQDTYLNVKGKSDLIKHVKKCFASLYTSRATYYRNKKGFKHENVKLAVVVQKMVDSDKSGVMFSKDPSYNSDNITIEAVFGLGEGIVSGKINPDTYIISPDMEKINKRLGNKKIAITRNSSGEQEIVKLRDEKAKSQVLTDYEIKILAGYAQKLEEHYKKPQDIEFAIENEEIFITQTRPITTIANRQEVGNIKELKGEVILQGLAASPGIAPGRIKIVDTMEDLQKVNKGDILVTKMTNPDMVVTMQRSSAIVTDEGGLTAHAAIVSREMGIPCIVGTGNATEILKEGEEITVDGYSGKIYKGKVSEEQQKEVLPIVPTKTKIKVILDLPSFAKRASNSQTNSVGLTRLEGIIAESGKHPKYFLEKGNLKEYEDLIYKGLQGIATYFDELWVRASDIRSDEFSNLEGFPNIKEANPMLGFHGIRYSLKNQKIFQAELNALKRISEENKKTGIILPQVISTEEVKKTKEIIKEIGAEKIKLGIMIETPASVEIIESLCEEGIDFISFGTNDLTQYTLAIDRGNDKVQFLFNEMHPAVLSQISRVIKVCKEKGVITSICGQSGSKKEMVKFLVEKGIDSISVNADMAHEISSYVAEIENGAHSPEIQENSNEDQAEEAVEETTEEVSEETVQEDKQDEVVEEQQTSDIEKEEVKEDNSESDDYENEVLKSLENSEENVEEEIKEVWGEEDNQENKELENEEDFGEKKEVLDIF